MSDFIMPSSVEDQKKITALMMEAVRCLNEIEVHKEDIKTVKSDLKEKFAMDGGTASKLIKAFYDADKVQQEYDDLGEIINTADILGKYK